jgi:hypothetical protein
MTESTGKKYPLGVEPRLFYLEKRVRELLRALSEYSEAKMWQQEAILAWSAELQTRLKELASLEPGELQ